MFRRARRACAELKWSCLLCFLFFFLLYFFPSARATFKPDRIVTVKALLLFNVLKTRCSRHFANSSTSTLPRDGRVSGGRRGRGRENRRIVSVEGESLKSLYFYFSTRPLDVIFVLINVSSSPARATPTWKRTSFNFSDKSRSADNKLRSKVNRLESWSARPPARSNRSCGILFPRVSSRDIVLH